MAKLVSNLHKIKYLQRGACHQMVRKEKQWQIYHKFEERNKVSFLKEISGNDGFRILKDLHQFAYKLESKINSKKLDIARIKTLSNVHSIFGKVKL